MPAKLSETQSRKSIADHIERLRSRMHREAIEAYIVPSSDEHLNEYLPESKKRREWISGFTGSAGDAVIGIGQAFLFVDSRYYEQADMEVSDSLYQVSKLGLEGHPSLLDILKRFKRIGVDPFTLTIEQYRTYKMELRKFGAVLVPVAENLIDAIRKECDDEPGLFPDDEIPLVFSLSESITGSSITEKLSHIRKAMADCQAKILPVTKLDQVAWLYNLRGQDIPYNPVFEAYALVTPEQAYLFMDADKIQAEDSARLSPAVTLLPYEHYLSVLVELASQPSPVAAGETAYRKLLLDPKQTTYGTFYALQNSLELSAEQLMNERIVQTQHPVLAQKAVKNKVELAGMKQANLLASKAKIRALRWLDLQLKNNAKISEVDFQRSIDAFYGDDAAFYGLSFNTIAAAGTHSSIVHYGTPSEEWQIQKNAFFLIDSGVQYLTAEMKNETPQHLQNIGWAGTTDDTRTVWTGDAPPVESLETQRYTRVLKAHIQCAMQQFPKGTPGSYLDAITRSSLWNAGLDFGHGTGHGVGAFLNVHEGPNGIHRLASEPLAPGMITSIEPGFYISGWGGIRLENLYVVIETGQKTAPDEKPLYAFETLTYIPFDAKLIDVQALSHEEYAWLKNYHTAVIEKMTPLLNPEDLAWLKTYCHL